MHVTCVTVHAHGISQAALYSCHAKRPHKAYAVSVRITEPPVDHVIIVRPPADAACSSPAFLQFLWLLRGDRRVSNLVLMLGYIIADMVPFLTIVVGWHFFCAAAMMLISRPNDEWDGTCVPRVPRAPRM